MAQRSSKNRYVLHILLFLGTVLTTLLAGSEYMTNKHWIYYPADLISRFRDGVPLAFDLSNFPEGYNPFPVLSDLWKGIPYSFAFLLFLTVHEFGHYFTAMYHRVKCSLPYYIPIFFPSTLNIGSFGAMIRIREVPKTTSKFFDIGVAGPLAGFVVSVGLLIYGFATLPPMQDHLYQMNPNYEIQYGGVPTEQDIIDGGGALKVGTNLLFEIFKYTIPSDPSRVPNHFELIHYPFLFVGYLTLFFTALNLLPVGQLDGGHVMFGLFGRKAAGVIARVAVGALIFVGGTGVVKWTQDDSTSFVESLGYLLLYLGYLFVVFRRMFRDKPVQIPLGIALGTFLVQGIINLIVPGIEINAIWLLYPLILVMMVGVDHPPAMINEKLTLGRKILGWLSIVIFILCFTPRPIYFVEGRAKKPIEAYNVGADPQPVYFDKSEYFIGH